MTRALSRLVAGSLLLAACNHQEPFQFGRLDSDSTPTSGTDRRLTFDPGTDITPAWLPDGSGFLYSYERLEAGLRDRCFALLGPAGGTRTELPCGITEASKDTIDTFYEAAPGPDGELLYVRESSIPGVLTPIAAALEIAALNDLAHPTVIRPLPYTASNGKTHEGVTHLRWRGPGQAVYLATLVRYHPDCSTCVPDTVDCPGCPPDTVRTGIELVSLDLTGATPVIQPIPNTEGASSVDVAGPDDIYFTRNGDSVIYHVTMSTGLVNPVHDFGSLGIVRDVSVRGNRLVAVVGGGIVFEDDAAVGPRQTDRGGNLYVLDLGTGIATQRVIDSHWLRHPRLSPTGTRLVAESRQLAFISCGQTCTDTVITPTSDLWLVDNP